MPSGIDNSGKYYYVKSGLTLSDTHGGHSEQHLREFEEVCNLIVDEKFNQLTSRLETQIQSIVEEYGRQVWSGAIQELVGALQTDISSQVNVGFDGLREVFYGEKCQKYISDSIMKTMLNEINKIKFTLK